MKVETPSKQRDQSQAHRLVISIGKKNTEMNAVDIFRKVKGLKVGCENLLQKAAIKLIMFHCLHLMRSTVRKRILIFVHKQHYN